MANSQASTTPYYIYTRPVPGTEGGHGQILFEIRGADRYIIKTAPSHSVPICCLHLHEADLPKDFASQILRTATPNLYPSIILDSEGAMIFKVFYTSTDSKSSEAYGYRMIERYMGLISRAMAGYINLPYLKGQDDFGPWNSWGESTKPVEVYGTHNLGKRFAEKVSEILNASTEIKEVVDWSTGFAATSKAREAQNKILVSIPSFALKRASDSNGWDLVPRKGPQAHLPTRMRKLKADTKLWPAPLLPEVEEKEYTVYNRVQLPSEYLI